MLVLRNLREHPAWHHGIIDPPPCQGGRPQGAAQKFTVIGLFLAWRPTLVVDIPCPRCSPCCGWGALVRRCCQIFRLPRTHPSYRALVFLLTQECVESQSRDLLRGKQLHPRGGLTLNMMMRGEIEILLAPWRVYVDCWHDPNTSRCVDSI